MTLRKKLGIAIAGGGSYGIVTLKTIEARHKVFPLRYDKGSATSTGALMLALIMLWKFLRGIAGYTGVKNKKIYSGVAPFNNKGHFRYLFVFWRFIRRKKTLGDSENLKKLIPEFFTQKEYEDLAIHHQEVIINRCETRQYPAMIERVSNLKNTWEDVCTAMFDSANAPPLFTLRRDVIKGRSRENTDGGVREGLPLMPLVLDEEIGEIHAFLHSHRPQAYDRGKTKNIFHHGSRMISVLREDAEFKSMWIALSKAKEKGIKVTLFFMPKEVKGNSLHFDPALMAHWGELGAKTAFDANRQMSGEEWLEFARPVIEGTYWNA